MMEDTVPRLNTTASGREVKRPKFLDQYIRSVRKLLEGSSMLRKLIQRKINKIKLNPAGRGRV